MAERVLATRAAPRLSRRAGRQKPRHAEYGARPALCGRNRSGGSFYIISKEEEKSLRSAARVRFGHGQRFRARARPVAWKSPPGGSLAGQSGLVFDVAANMETHSSDGNCGSGGNEAEDDGSQRSRRQRCLVVAPRGRCCTKRALPDVFSVPSLLAVMWLQISIMRGGSSSPIALPLSTAQKI